MRAGSPALGVQRCGTPEGQARSSGESGPSGCTLANGEVVWGTGALLSSSVGFLGSVLGDNLTLVSKTLVEGLAIWGPQSYL